MEGISKMDEENLSDIWEVFPGKDDTTLALPDFYSNYFDYSFDRSQGRAKYVGLRVTGEFAYARYMSFNIYDAHEGVSQGALTDFQIKPLPGSVNPFVAGSDANLTNRSYSITVLPEGYSTDGQDNVLTFASEAINVLTLMLRYYVPQGPFGSVPLPKVEAFDARSGKCVRLPSPYRLRGSMPKVVLRGRLHPVFRTDIDDTLRFYHAGGGGQFNNADNMYLITAIKDGEGQVLLIRIKPPSYPLTNDEYDRSDVRYWSVNEGDADTSTAFGMKDEEFKRARDGFVYIAIGDPTIKTTAEERGYNFMPWRAKRRKSVVLYRNMVTNPQFRANLSKVPEIVPKDLLNKQNFYEMNAKNYIGDYAPTGVKVSQKLFMRGGQRKAEHNIVPPLE
jgi:hypothetical protein